MASAVQFENAVISGYPIVLPPHRAAFHREHPNWHKGWLDSIHQHLKPDDVVIDVGSEQGDLSALIASWVPDGGIVLVEPQPLFWPTIRETFEANGLKSLMTFQGFAADRNWNRGGRFELAPSWPDVAYDMPVRDPGFYHFDEHTLDNVCLDGLGIAPMAVLIDSEGSELVVLHGADEVLSTFQPQVWCAIHPEIMRDRYGHDPNDLLEYMKGFGYRNEVVGFQGEIHVRFYQ